MVSLVCLAAAVAAAAIDARPGARQTPRPANQVLVFAAASLQTALDALQPIAATAIGVELTVAYAASSALARQIESGAPADVFISADLEWMDYLAERRLIQPESRSNLLGNQLVLIAPASAPGTLKIAPGFPLATALGRERLAVADPTAVPAGKYAKAALTKLGVWESVSTRLAPAENVRAALLLVARGESPLGIVYRTDALAEPRVKIVDTFPESAHPAITYPMALTPGATPAAARFIEFLRSPAAQVVFTAQGFTVLR